MRTGRPPKPPAERSDKRPRTVRLSAAHWAELRRRGTRALERWLDKPEDKPQPVGRPPRHVYGHDPDPGF